MGLADRVLLEVGNRRKLGENVTRAVTSIERDGSMEDFPALTLTVDDPRGELMESDLLTKPTVRALGTPEAAELRMIDLELDRVVYRLQVAERDGATVLLRFDHRGAVYMGTEKGALTASRGSTTRAQFIRRQVDDVNRRRKASQRLAFWTWEVDRRMPTAVPDSAKVSKRSEGRDVTAVTTGAKAFKGITELDGHPVDYSQRMNMAIVLGVAEELGAGPTATLALVMACIVEAPAFNNPTGGDSSSVGILQLLDSHLGGSVSTDGGRRDVALVAHIFLTKGFTDGVGAMAYAAKNPGTSAGAVAQHCQGSAYPERYDQVRSDALRVVAAGGGIEVGGRKGEGGSYVKPYRFKRPENEGAWINTGKLAEEVGRRRFITLPRRGTDLFVYASDEDLLRLDSQATIDADAGYVVGEPRYVLDYGRTVRAVTVTVRGDEFEADFAWGIPVDLEGAGPADGKYLVWSVLERDGSPDVELELRMPVKAKPEPSSEVVARTDNAEKLDLSADGAVTGEGPLAVYERAKSISDRGYPYVWAAGHSTPGTPDGGDGSDPGIGFDCSGYVGACLYGTEAFPEAWSDYVPASGEMAATYGVPGEGRWITLWSNAGHVFLEFKIPGKPGRFADTSREAAPPADSGPRLRYGDRSTAGYVARHHPGF